jgi:hypothetical protein
MYGVLLLVPRMSGAAHFHENFVSPLFIYFLAGFIFI